MYVNEVFPNDVQPRKSPVGWQIPSAWTDERTAKLKELWPTGKSASVIAKEIGGLSRNAVIGKVRRLGLEPRKNIIRKKSERRGSWTPPEKTEVDKMLERHSRPPRFLTEPLPTEPPRPAKLFKLVDLNEGQCRFPYGDGRKEPFGFCGCKKLIGSQYCPGHHGLCTTGPQPRRRKSSDYPLPAMRSAPGSHRVLREVIA
jgi:GcrA cell cycle regulator